MGFVTEPYDTVKGYFYAIDSDGTAGPSNEFVFGTGDPTPECRDVPYAPEFITFYTGRDIQTQLAVPFGDQGDVKFTLIDGELPEGLRLEDGGRVVGMTRTAQPKTDISVRVDVITRQTTLTAQCNYTIEVKNELLKLVDTTPAQNQHGRVGAPYSGQITAKGSIPDFTIDWTGGLIPPTLSANVPVENQVTVPVTGTFEKPGLPNSYSFTIINGDTNTAAGEIDLYSYGPLAFGEPRTHVPNITVKRLEYGPWDSIPYDKDTVVPDTSGAVAMPVLTVSNTADLPDGVVFDGRKFGGMTALEPAQYGPFRVTMSDYTGESLESDQFYVNVEPREENVVASVEDQVFTVEQVDRQFGKAPVVQFPPGAKNFTRTFTLHGPELPAWAHFDPATGSVSADPNVPYGDLEQPANTTVFGPYTVTVTDDDPVEPSTSEHSPEFYVRLVDLPPPSGETLPKVLGTVSGDADEGFRILKKAVMSVKSMVGIQSTRQKTVTNLVVRDLASRIKPKTIIGDVKDVIFTHSEPAAPAGVPLQISADGHNAWFDGSPTEPFEGTVEVYFKDSRGRVGAILVPMEIKPYPSATMTQESYDLPRLAPAIDYNIVPNNCDDCWSAPKWELDPNGGPLPEGLSVNPTTGAIINSTEELDDETPGTNSPFSGIVLKATSRGVNGESLVFWTDPFEIKIKPRVPMELKYPTGPDVWYLNDKTSSTGYTFNSRDISAPYVSGSHRPAVTYRYDSIGLRPLQSVNSTTGIFAWDLSDVTLGRFSTEVTAVDSEGQEAPATLDIKATLEGGVKVVSAGGELRLRQSESFMTGDPDLSPKHAKPIIVEHAVGEMTYSVTGAPATVLFSPSDLFLEGSRFDQKGYKQLYITGKDADDRKLDILAPITYSFDIVEPLAFVGIQKGPFAGRQYSVEEPINASFPSVTNVMDSLEFEIRSADGQDIPGTIVYKFYDSEGNFGYWQWSNPDGSGNVVAADDPLWEDKLPLDALVFDPEDMTLKGIPSKAGTFNLELVARDTYRNSYLHQDDANYPEEKRQENNTATTQVTLQIAPAHDLEIVNVTHEGETSTEAFPRFTQSPTMRGVVSNAAYGRPLTWTKVTGTLPDGIYVAPTSINLVFGSYAENMGTFSNIVYEGVDRAGRKIRNDAITFEVGERQTFELVATSNPKKMAVFLTDADLTVTPKNQAYGRNIGKNNWSVTGQQNLPPQVKMTIDDRAIRFSGTSNVVGTYGPVVVTARDALNAIASVSLTFEVRIPDGPIQLDVTNIKTKQTYPFQMQATATNTYGTVRFYSYNITDTHAANMTLNEASGFISGKYDEPTKFTFDTYVTDSTNRVTSRPTNVEVLPFLRVIVPQTVRATETINLVQDVATDYVLGTVTYEKGQGDWPDGLTVNPTTGRISGASRSEPGTYSGLTIKATDTFTDYLGQTYTDVQESNVFEIALDGIPEISDVKSTEANRLMLYTKDVQAQSWFPTVIDKITRKTWNLPNTVYSINKDFEYETGLNFDTSTGEISGTPTKLVVYKDLTITVTSPHGNTDTTAPFWFAVQPQGTIWARAGQTDTYRNRVGTLMATEAPIFDNTVGEVVYTATGVPRGMSVDSRTGIVSGTPTGAGTSTVVVTATDGAMRTATLTYTIVNKGALDLTLAKPTNGINIGQNYTNLNKPTATNVGGTATYTATGLPNGITLNTSTGALAGSPSDTIPNNTEFPVTVRITDDFDGEWKEINYTLTVALPILPAPDQTAVYNLRHNEPFETDAPIFTNAIGGVTYSINGFAAGQGGLKVDANTGIISGTPVFVSSGSYPNYYPPSHFTFVVNNITLTVTDSTGRTGTLKYVINTRRDLTMTLANPIIAIDFDKAYTNINKPTVTNGGGTLTFTATGLPDGLTINPSTGAISGTVPSGRYQVGDTFNVVVTLTDAYDGDTTTVSYPLTLADQITVPTGQKTTYAVRVGDTLTVDLPRVENAFGTVTWSASGKPAWLNLSAADGALSGTATGTFNGTVTLTATDSINRTASIAYSIVSRQALGLTLTPTLNGLDFGKVYSANQNRPTTSGIGGTARFEDVGGVISSMGLTFNTANGSFSGSILNSLSHGDKFQAVVRVYDSFDDLRAQLVDEGNVSTPVDDLTPYHREVTYELTATSPITAVAGQTTSYILRVGDTLTVDLPMFDNVIGTPTYSQSGKPSWLVFSTIDGSATGTATAVSNGSTIRVTVKDETNRTATFDYQVTTKAQLGLTIPTVINGINIGETYGPTNVPKATNVAGTASYEDVGDVIANTGLTFDRATGSFSGQMSADMQHGDTVNVAVRLTDSYDAPRLQLIAKGNVVPPASDANPGYREVSYSLTAAHPLTIVPGQKDTYTARVGDTVTTDPVLVNHAVGNPEFVATGMPAGLSVDPATGSISGTVQTAGNYTIVVTARDASLRTAVFTYTLTTKGKFELALAQPLTDIWQSAAQVYEGINQPTATNVGGTVSYTVVGLPSQFTFDSNTGGISGYINRGTYPNGTTFPVTVTATDSFDGMQKEVAYTLAIRNAPDPTISVEPAETGYIATAAAAVTPTVTNGKTGDIVTVEAGQLPPGFSIVQENGVWKLMKVATSESDIGVYKGIRLRITDTDGRSTVSQPFDMIIRPQTFLSFATQVVEARADVPMSIPGPTPATGVAIEDLTFSFTTDVTGGKLKINPTTGTLSGTFSNNGTNVVKVVEHYNGKPIREFSYNLTLKIVQLSVKVSDFAVLADVAASKQVVVEYPHSTATFALTGNVPAGISINSDGVINGTASTPGVYQISVVYEDDYAMVTVPVRMTVIDSSAGHRFWKVNAIRTAGGSAADGALYEVVFYDAGNNEVQNLGTVSGDPSVFDGDFSTGVPVGASGTDLIVSYEKNVAISRAVATAIARKAGTAYSNVVLTYYWSDDGVNWTKAGGTTTVGYNSGLPVTATTTIGN
jgi:Putative Ig domain.